MTAWAQMGGLPILGGIAGYASDGGEGAVTGASLPLIAGQLLGRQGGRRFLSGDLATQRRIAKLIQQGKLPPASIIGSNIAVQE